MSSSSKLTMSFFDGFSQRQLIDTNTAIANGGGSNGETMISRREVEPKKKEEHGEGREGGSGREGEGKEKGMERGGGLGTMPISAVICINNYTHDTRIIMCTIQ